MAEKTSAGGPGRWRQILPWILNNGPALITVLGSAALAVLASVVSFTTLQLLQAVLALLALIGTSLLTERLVVRIPAHFGH